MLQFGENVCSFVESFARSLAESFTDVQRPHSVRPGGCLRACQLVNSFDWVSFSKMKYITRTRSNRNEEKERKNYKLALVY